ncbi:MAG: leucine-rich repeat domain-containing protein [Bacteroidales bacterium]|nr:leucine-rich repeat domain-containing protein [Bacteroidales bacterium]
MKKLFFTLAILAGFAVQALAYDFQVDGICYNVKSDSLSTVSVTYGDEDYSGNIVIPSTVTVDGRIYTVVEIETHAFAYCEGLLSVDIPNTVTFIGDGAFQGSADLVSVTLPNAITTIQYATFKDCKSLESIVLPNSIDSIEGHSWYNYGAFAGCTNLASITFPNAIRSIGRETFLECSSLTSIDLPNSLEEIGEFAFCKCYNLTSIHWPEGIHELPKGVFGWCTALESYEVPDHIVAIGEEAFYHCDGLTSITIPNSVTTIGLGAFSGCSNLTSVHIPSSVTSIGGSAFRACSNLVSINIPDGVTVIQGWLFGECTSLPEINLPNTITRIGNNAFYMCDGLTSVQIPPLCDSIGFFAFSGCKNLTSIDLGNVRSLSNDVFGGCDRLENVVIPNTVKAMSYSVFSSCVGLKNVVIGNAVETMGPGFFFGCSSLQNVVMLGSVPPELTGNANQFFDECGEELRLIVPCGSGSLYKESGFGGCIDESRIVEDCNQHNINVIGDENGGQVTLSVNSAMMGEEITYSVDVQPDYVFNGVVVYKADDETFRIPVADNKFVMPNFDVTVKADFEYLNIGEGQPEWYYEIQNENGSITYQHLEYAGDTTINHKEVTIIIRTNTLYDKGEHTETTREYIYEERTLRGNKVYWWNKDLQEFTVLYDFGAQEGDSWGIKVGTASLTMHVDAVEQYEYEGRVFRMLQVSDDQDLFGGTIVCGIGHLSSFFPERLMNRSKNYRVEGMRCYWREGELFFKYGNRDCNEVYEEWHNGIEEDGPSTGIGTLTVYPNPTDGVLFVQTLRATSLPTQTYHITNLMGQTVQTGNLTAETQQIDVSGLPKGMYFITLGEETRKFVVQ